MSSAHGAPTAGAVRLTSPFTRLAPEVKIVGLVTFLMLVALTPARNVWVFAVAALVVAVSLVIALVPIGTVLARLLLEIPVAMVALTYVFFGREPKVEVLGISMSEPGLWVAFGVMAKATIGVFAVSVVAASTTATELTAGLSRLGLPGWFCDMVALTARQVGILRADAERIRLAAELRGSGGKVATWKAVARGLGTLFVQASARAERLATSIEVRNPTPEPVNLTSGSGLAPTATAQQWLLALVPTVTVGTAILVSIL